MNCENTDRRETFGEWLRRQREERGLGIDRAARMAGVAATTLRRIEQGDTPSIEVARQLAEGMRLDSAELYRRVAYLLGMRSDRRGTNAALRINRLADAAEGTDRHLE